MISDLHLRVKLDNLRKETFLVLSLWFIFLMAGGAASYAAVAICPGLPLLFQVVIAFVLNMPFAIVSLSFASSQGTWKEVAENYLKANVFVLLVLGVLSWIIAYGIVRYWPGGPVTMNAFWVLLFLMHSAVSADSFIHLLRKELD